MGRLILVTGGTRSGKSDFAQKLAESLSGPRYFVATCPKIDPEMDDRIRRHQRARAHADWKTVEEETDLAKIFEQVNEAGVCLIDCLTLWVNNLLYHEKTSGEVLTEEKISKYCAELVFEIKGTTATVICVTNEIGMGVVPENQTARRYRDLVGCCNRCIAKAAEEVILVTCGIPLTLKNI